MVQEYMHLRGAAMMDACCQPKVMLSLHTGRPYVFTTAEECHLIPFGESVPTRLFSSISQGAINLLNEQFESLGTMTGTRVSILRPAQLQVLRTRKQMYTVTWVPNAAADAVSAELKNSNLLRSVLNSVGVVSNGGGGALCKDTIGLTELSAALATLSSVKAVLCCWRKLPDELGSHVMADVLRMLQSVTNVKTRVQVWIMVSAGSVRLAGTCGMLKSVYAETNHPLCVAQIDDGQAAESCVAEMQLYRQVGREVVELELSAVGSRWNKARLAATNKGDQVHRSVGLEDTVMRVLPSVLVAGGTGGLGRLVSCWLVERGSATITMVSRSGTASTGAKQHWQRMLHQLGSSLCVELSNMGPKIASLSAVERTGTNLTSLIHAAGTLADAVSSLTVIYQITHNSGRFRELIV